MLLVGLTGGIGMGKSTVADYLAGRGEKVIDSDLLARQVVEPGQPALEEIRRVFGEEVFAAGGALERKELARIVFEDEPSRKKLEAILHPRIRELWRRQAEAWRTLRENRAFVVIPLLYETGAESELDRVVCIACSAGVQKGRLEARGWSRREMEQRIKAQWPIGTKMDRADAVIWNESTKAVCAEQCTRLFGTG